MAPEVEKMAEEGTMVDLEDDELYIVRAFPIVLTGDMPQNADNAGFMRHQAQKGCRGCYTTQEERGNLDYDITGHGRYHYDTVFLRKEGRALPTEKARTKFFKNLGMRQDPPAITMLYRALNLILGLAYDLPHSHWRGMGCIVFTLLLENMLTLVGGNKFTEAFQQLPFPPTWKRIQSPLHLKQWSMSEAGQGLILLPLVLRHKAEGVWFKPGFLQAMDQYKQTVDWLEDCAEPLHALIKVLRLISEVIVKTGSYEHSLTESEVHDAMLQACKCCHLLMNVAEMAETLQPHRDAPGADDQEDILDDVQDDTVDTEFPDLLRDGDNDLDEDDTHDASLPDLFDDEGNAAQEAFPDPASSNNHHPAWAPPPTSNASNASNASDASNDSQSHYTATSPSDHRSQAPPVRKKHLTKWDRLRSLPNMHVGLHISMNTAELAHTMNGNVLPGENRHR
jgi:hypothetical protein